MKMAMVMTMAVERRSSLCSVIYTALTGCAGRLMLLFSGHNSAARHRRSTERETDRAILVIYTTQRRPVVGEGARREVGRLDGGTAVEKEEDWAAGGRGTGDWADERKGTEDCTGELKEGKEGS